jgi:hypothetical protein
MIEHPFVGDLKDKSLEELTDTVSSLYKKMNWAASNGNYSLANQIQMVLASYRAEVARKQAELFDNNTGMIQGKIDIS